MADARLAAERPAPSFNMDDIKSELLATVRQELTLQCKELRAECTTMHEELAGLSQRVQAASSQLPPLPVPYLPGLEPQGYRRYVAQEAQAVSQAAAS